jgi:6-phospho-3-hexuloisomerase
MNEIFKELQLMWDGTDKNSLNSFIETLVYSKGKTVVGLGAGRMGYSLQSFMMRLSHLGFAAYMIGDTTLPRVDSETIAIVNTSSGETPSIKLYVEQCRQTGVYVVAFTTNPQSSIAVLADLVVSIPSIDTHQLMKTIYEQYSFVLFDYIADKTLNLAELEVGWVEQNHSILE